MSSSRLAAWLALAAGAAVAATLVLLLVRDVLVLGAAVAALAVAGAASWVALTRGGIARVIGVVVALAALAAGGAALLVREALYELLALGIALAAFAAASRFALRRGTPQRVRSTTRSGPTGRDGFVLLMNPRSGEGKVERFDLVGEARRRGIEPVLMGPDDDLLALAKDAARSAEVIGMAGGDGSQALVAQVAIEHDLAYVCVPAGTRNHLALDLGLDRGDVVGALDAFAADAEERIDVGFVNEQLFVNNVSLGIYAEVVQSAAYRDAKVETMEKMLPELLGPRADPFDLRFTGPTGAEQSSAQLVLVSNNPYELDRLAGMGSRPRLDSGKLGIVAVEIGDATQAAELAALHAVGQIRRFHGWREWTSREFEVDSAKPVAAGIDGEAVVLDPPLRFRLRPSALRVRLPPTAPGLSPAALSPGLTRSGIRDLWDIAAGRGPAFRG
jgi:diacylglycerol kinase family enzyme